MSRLETLIANYMKNCESIKKLDKKTLKAYRIDLAQFHAFMLEYPDFEDKTAINDYISSLHDQYKPRTTKRKIAALKAFFHHLVYEEIITLNPFDKINVIKLVRFADKHGVDGHLPVPVHILADELANTGAILELNKKISVCRSRGLSISCIFQNLPQMQNRYPFNQWQEIIGNCDSQLFLGCTDESNG